jgi:hypothetical protein
MVTFKMKPVVVAHASNQRGKEAEAEGSWVRGQPGLRFKKKMLTSHRRKDVHIVCINHVGEVFFI